MEFALVQQDHRKLLLNLDRVTAVDTQGFGVFVTARGVVAKVHGHIALVCATNRFLNLLVITGLLTHFRIFDSEEQAFRWFSTVDEGRVEVAGRAEQMPALGGGVSDRLQAN